jgi:antidote-toxin recognition MazE-like antitoxin
VAALVCDCAIVTGQNSSNSRRLSSARRFDPVSNAGLKIYSLAIRLPRSVVEVLGLKDGDSIEIHVADRRVFAIEKTPDHAGATGGGRPKHSH